MAERRVSVRLGVIGGKEVEATFENVGNRGAGAMKRLGDASEQAFERVERGSSRMGGGLQNVGYQVQDFAVQVGGGTSATQALAQQLPQLLSGFGLVGVLAGTAAAILIPLAKVMFDMGEKAVAAGEQVDALVAKIGILKQANEVYSLDGLQALIDKYGEANAAVLLMVERQQALAEQNAFEAARATVASLAPEVDGVVSSLREFDTTMTLIGRNNYGDVQAQKAQALLTITEILNDEYGLTLDRARDLESAFAALKAAQTVQEMADAAATLTGLIEGSTLAGGELEQTLLDAEDALRQLNAEGMGVNSWMDAAIQGAYSFAGQLWEAARAATAVRAAQARPPSDEALQRQAYGQGQQALRDRMIADRGLYGGSDNGLTTSEEYQINPSLRPTPIRPGRTGAGAGAGRSATSDIEREAARIFESTRTAAEQYSTELARLNEIRDAGLISGDTYNRQLQALGDRYKEEATGIAALQSKLEDFVKASANIADGIGDALVGAFESGADAVGKFVKTGKLDMTSLVTSFIADLARLAAQRFIFGPIANILSGAIGGLSGGGGIIGQALASILHDGGTVGSAGGTRSVDPSVFNGARRMHGGGVAGLAGDEVPAILQRGERVLSKSQNAAYERGGVPTIIFNVKDAASLRQSRGQIAADAARAVAMGRRNS